MGDTIGCGNSREIMSSPRAELMERLGLTKRSSNAAIGAAALELLNTGEAHDRIDAQALVQNRDISLNEAANILMVDQNNHRSPEEVLESITLAPSRRQRFMSFWKTQALQNFFIA